MDQLRRAGGVIVMPANNSSMHLGWLAGRYPGRIGWLLSPGGWRTPHRWMPYALDNGAFPAWTNGKPWDEAAFLEMADREATLASWQVWAPRLREHGWPLAFAVQDGMTPEDVPGDADVIFVGGTTEWKWRTVLIWCQHFPRVHVGRVNSYRLLWSSHDAGAESCDGTGWFRGDQDQLAGLERYLEESSNQGRPQMRLVN